jgi:uncharacterized protein (TIGR03435 family)
MLATAEGKGITALTARRISIPQFVETLQDQLHAPVIDQSGLSGRFYFAFKCVRVDASADADADAPTLFEAVQESLGLRLEKQAVPVNMLVVDHMEREPAGN